MAGLPLSTFLASRTIPDLESTENVTILRATQSGLNLTQTTIYAGPADFQAGSSSEFFDPGGAVQTIEAVLVITAATVAALPAVKAGDVVQVAGAAYEVIDAKAWTYGGLPHLEIPLKDGPLEYKGPK